MNSVLKPAVAYTMIAESNINLETDPRKYGLEFKGLNYLIKLLEKNKNFYSVSVAYKNSENIRVR